MESKDLCLKCTARIDWPFCRRATHNININLAKVLELGELWSSASLIDFANSLTPTTPNANAGNLVGNRMFYAEDYMVGTFFASIQYLFTLNFFEGPSWVKLCDICKDVLQKNQEHGVYQ
jgi:hypothetical protein